MTRTIITFCLFISTVTSANAGSEPNQIHDLAIQCGINALHECMRYLDINVTLEQLYSDIPRSNNNQVNLYQLALYARNLGIYIKAIKHPTLSPLKKYLTGVSCAIIQFKYPNGKPHMAALSRPQDKDIWISDISMGKSTITDDALRVLLQRSQGMLILSKDPFEKSIFYQMNFSRRIWSFIAIITLGVLIATILSLRRDKGKTL